MNTIKTKIGFDIKPYAIPTLYFNELFHISLEACGQTLLLLAIVLSIGNWMYLRSVTQQKLLRLDRLQQEVVQLKDQHKALTVEYESLASEDRLKLVVSEIPMKQPTLQETIWLPTLD